MEWQTVDKSPSSAMPQLTRLLLLLLQGSIDRHEKEAIWDKRTDWLVYLDRLCYATPALCAAKTRLYCIMCWYSVPLHCSRRPKPKAGSQRIQDTLSQYTV
jgi:hypothetical protein